MKIIIFIFVILTTSCSVNCYRYWDDGTLKEKGCIIGKPIKGFTLKIENNYSDTLLIDTFFNKKKGIWITYNNEGKKLSEGRYKPFLVDNTFAYIDSKSLETILLITKDSQKEGEWIYYKNDLIFRKEIWRNGKLIEVITFN